LASSVLAFAGLMYMAVGWAAAAPQATAVSATGPIEIRNSHDGGAIFSAERIVPGWSADGEVSISNSGGTAGKFSLELGHLREAPRLPGGRLSDRLRLVVTEIGGGRSAPVYAGPLSGLGVRDLHVLEPGEGRSYHLRMSFPDGGPHGADNPLQGGRVKAGFVWTAVAAP
jgi:hypothetical protein